MIWDLSLSVCFSVCPNYFSSQVWPLDVAPPVGESPTLITAQLILMYISPGAEYIPALYGIFKDFH